MATRFVIGQHQRAGFRDCLFHVERQTCETAQFKQPGWNACTADKFRWLSTLEPDGEPILFVDADVLILPGLAEWCAGTARAMPDNVILFGDDKVQLCTGVMLFKKDQRVLDWFKFCYDFCTVMDQNDQDGLHLIGHIARQTGVVRLPVALQTMANDVICNWASLGNTTTWDHEQIQPPSTMLLWHANWCVGVENKTAMLETVQAANEYLQSA
jgi:hypothetical protein